MRRRTIERALSVLGMWMLMTFGILAQAQTGTIKGVVKDASGPIAGASVTLSNKGGGTTTNAAGIYELKVKAGRYTITISYVGMAAYSTTVEVKAGQTVTENVTLKAEAQTEDIVVVGSRTAGRTKLATPVPVDVISVKEMKGFAQADPTQILTYLAPSFQSARQTISDGTDHIDPAGLRGLGPDQTLVLLNGKRRHNTALVNINGTVGRGSVGTDLNAIPVAAIERIEVLRDGAAAQYGSDAIAGVINIVLKKNYKGLNISGLWGQNYTNLKYGQTIRIQDGMNKQLDLYGGFPIGKGGSVVVSGQYLSRDRTNRSGNDNIPLIYYGNGGALPSPPSGFDVVAYRRGVIDLDNAMVAARGYNRHNIVAGNSANENINGFLNANLPIGKNTELYLTFGAGHRKGDASGFSRNPNSASQQPITSTGQRYYVDGFLPEIHTTIKDISNIFGIRSKLGSWNWDLSNTQGTNSIDYNIQNTGNASLTPAGAVQTQFNAGGLRFLQNTTNLDFSRKFNDAGAFKNLNIGLGAEFRYEQFQIVAGELNSYANGGRLATINSIPEFGIFPAVNLGTTPAGAGAQVFPGFGPNDALKKDRNIIAGYVDVEGTLNKLLLGAAARYEKYSDFGSGFGGKISGRYDIDKKYAIRASANAGFRAPSLHQRYFQNTSTQFVAGLPSQSLTANNDNAIVRNGFGIQSLKPERSISFSAGFVGKINNNITLTVDGYLINIYDRIVLSSAFNRSNPLVAPLLAPYPGVNVVQFWTNAVDTRTAGVDVVFTDKFKLGKGNATFSIAGNYNSNKVVGDLKTNSKIDDPANNPSLTDPTKNPANDFRTALFDRQQRSRIEVAQPRSKVNFTFNYQIGKFDWTFRTVQFGKTQYVHNLDPLAKQPSGALWNDLSPQIDQTFSPKWVTDLVISYKVCNGLTATIGANNIFDIYPDRIFIDPRNDPKVVYNTPVAGANGTVGGYSAGRDASNRGRFLFNPNQFGYNGRYVYGRVNIDIMQLKDCKLCKPKPLPVVPPVEVVAPPVAKVEPPKDTDKDGFIDAEDECPTVPGKVKGCPDTDGDGIADKNDDCPNEKGTYTMNGCPDRDGDLVIDKNDKCPDVAGPAANGGCPWGDADSDGVTDDLDKCPNEKGTLANSGCPDVKKEEMKVEAQVAMTEASGNIYFQTGSAKLLMNASTKGALNKVQKTLADNPDVTLVIEGHTDNTGTPAKNKVLSLNRAKSVMNALKKKGVDAGRMQTVGFGQDQPVATNKTAAGRAKNRRVVLKIQ